MADDYTFALPKSIVRKLEQEAKQYEELIRLRREVRKLQGGKMIMPAIEKIRLQLDKLARIAGAGAATTPRGPGRPPHWTKQPGVDPKKIETWQDRRLQAVGLRRKKPKTFKIGDVVTDHFANGKIRKRTVTRKWLDSLKREPGGKAAALTRDQYGHFRRKDGKPPKPSVISPEARAKMREAGLRTAKLLKERAAARKAAQQAQAAVAAKA